MASGRTPEQRSRRRVYNTRSFKNYKEYLRINYLRCWVTDDNGPCPRRGTIPDHDPPVCMVPNALEWHGVYRPQCQYHSDKQRGMLGHAMGVRRNYRPTPTREW